MASNVVPLQIPYRGISARYPLVSMPPEFAPWVCNLELKGGILESPVGAVYAFTARTASVQAMGAHPTNPDLIVHIDTTGGTSVVKTYNPFTGAVASPGGSVANAGGTPKVTALGFAGNLYFFVQGGAPVVFDGTTAAAVGFTGPTLANIVGGFAHKERMHVFTHRSQSVWFGGLGSIAGTFTEFPLKYVTRDNGIVMCGFSFSLSGNGTQPQDVWCVVLDTGEVIAYQGSNPANVSTWTLLGRARIAAPLGYQSIVEANGDVFVLTRQGVVSMRELFTTAGGDVQAASITTEIEPYWTQFIDDLDAISSPTSFDPRAGLIATINGAFHHVKNKLVIFFPDTLRPKGTTTGEFGYALLSSGLTLGTPMCLVYDFPNKAWFARTLHALLDAPCDGTFVCSYYHPRSNRLLFGSSDTGVDRAFRLWGSGYVDNPFNPLEFGVIETLAAEIVSAPVAIPGNKKVSAVQLLQAGTSETKSAAALRVRGDLGRIQTGQTSNASAADGIERTVYSAGLQSEFVQWDLATNIATDSGVPYQVANINVIFEQGGTVG